MSDEGLKNSLRKFTFTTNETRKGDSVDRMGYLGPHIRVAQRKLSFQPISTLDLKTKISNFGSIRQKIRDIDREKSGSVTVPELEDIIKIANPELYPYDLKEPLRDFTHAHNSLVVDYNKFLSKFAAA